MIGPGPSSSTRQRVSQDDVNTWFALGGATQDQLSTYSSVAESFRQCGTDLIRFLPPGPDSTFTFRLMRMAMDTAIDAVRHNGGR